jgi:hypothetical protein
VEKEGSSSLGVDVDVERSEASAASSIRRARGESREGNGGWVGTGVPRGGGRKKERGGRCGGSSRTMGLEWLQAAWSEVTNRGGRRGAADRWGRAATGPSVSSGVQEGEG